MGRLGDDGHQNELNDVEESPEREEGADGDLECAD